MIRLPALIISMLLALAYAAAFHLWKGRNLKDLLVFWLASILGFAAGQLVGQILDPVLWTLGQVHIVEATLGAFLFMALTRWLRLEKQTP